MAQDLDAAIVIAIGGNLSGRFDSRQQLLEAALARFPQATVRIAARSSWWRSTAWPDASQPEFVNGVTLVTTPLPPRALLAFLLGLEAAFGRVRGAANAPRTLDLDLIAYGRNIISAPGLRLPHPRATERRFVMLPLAEIAPNWRHPVNNLAAAELAADASIGGGCERVAATD